MAPAIVELDGIPVQYIAENETDFLPLPEYQEAFIIGTHTGFSWRRLYMTAILGSGEVFAPDAQEFDGGVVIRAVGKWVKPLKK